MKLPTWDECDDALKGLRTLDPLEQFVYDNEPAGPHEMAFRAQLQAALDYVLMPRMKKADGEAPRTTKASQRAMPQIRLGDPAYPDGITARPAGWNETVVRAGSVDPVATEAWAAPLQGKTWRGTGKMAATADGQLAEIGTWINPAGEVEAVRLTKATGIPHSVDPRTGEIVKAGGGTVDVAAAPALIPDQKPVEFNPDALVQFDVRPILNASALVPEPRHQIA